MQAWWAARISDAVLLIVGAAIGFLSSELKERLGERRIRAAFLQAIRQEVTTIREQLHQSQEIVEGGLQRFRNGELPPQFDVTFATVVFDGQFGHLKDVSDQNVLAVAKFYSSLSSLHGLGELLNKHAFEYLRNSPATRSAANRMVQSTLKVIDEELQRRLRMADDLLRKLAQQGRA